MTRASHLTCAQLMLKKATVDDELSRLKIAVRLQKQTGQQIQPNAFAAMMNKINALTRLSQRLQIEAGIMKRKEKQDNLKIHAAATHNEGHLFIRAAHKLLSPELFAALQDEATRLGHELIEAVTTQEASDDR